jgi:hypothetical protein
MNSARALYLSSYGIIDTIDWFTKAAKLMYQTWKYWHAAMLQGKATGIAVAYDIYLEAAEGDLRPEWKVPKPVSYHKFQDLLSQQMLEWNARKRKYPGDQSLRPCTQQDKKRRRGPNHTRGTTDGSFGSAHLVSVEQTKENGQRLCGNLTDFLDHVESRHKVKHGGTCSFCSEQCFTKCGKCKKFICFYPSKGKNEGKACYGHYHNSVCFGLGIADQQKYLGETRSSWVSPTPKHFADQRVYMEDVLKRTSTQETDSTRVNLDRTRFAPSQTNT